MPSVLCIETATEVCSVALGNGDDLLLLREDHTPNAHSSRLTVFMDECMKDSGIRPDAVAVSIGPGSYTGLRIGLSAAKGLCYALDIPLITIPTLQAMAAGAMKKITEPDKNFLVCPMIDARRMEVYAALYDAAGKEQRAVQADIVTEETYLPWLQEHSIYFSGNGMPKCKSLLAHPHARFLDDALPSAKHMLPLAVTAFEHGKFADLAYSEPFYLKEFEAKPARKEL